MTTHCALPTPVEAAQLHRLRQLHVDRARVRGLQAEAALDAARAALEAREASIATLRARLDAQADARAGAAFVDLPRWGEAFRAHRELLLDRLEREDYARRDDQTTCDQAAAELAVCRRALSRARSREDTMQGLVQQVRRALTLQLEQKAEHELESIAPGQRGGWR